MLILIFMTAFTFSHLLGHSMRLVFENDSTVHGISYLTLSLEMFSAFSMSQKFIFYHCDVVSATMNSRKSRWFFVHDTVRLYVEQLRFIYVLINIE